MFVINRNYFYLHDFHIAFVQAINYVIIALKNAKYKT